MTFRSHLSRIFNWWHRQHPDRTLEAIPAYADAARRERIAKARNDTKALGRAREAKKAALHSNMAGQR